jgi:hypothetical protein
MVVVVSIVCGSCLKKLCEVEIKDYPIDVIHAPSCHICEGDIIKDFTQQLKGAPQPATHHSEPRGDESKFANSPSFKDPMSRYVANNDGAGQQGS